MLDLQDSTLKKSGVSIVSVLVIMSLVSASIGLGAAQTGDNVVTGTITDEDGNVVSDATVTVQNQTVSTDSDGTYNVSVDAETETNSYDAEFELTSDSLTYNMGSYNFSASDGDLVVTDASGNYFVWTNETDVVSQGDSLDLTTHGIESSDVTVEWVPDDGSSNSVVIATAPSTGILSFDVSVPVEQSLTVDVSADGYTDTTETVSYTDGTVTQDLSLSSTNSPPVVDEIDNRTVEVGEMVSEDITATDADGDNITYSWTAQNSTYNGSSIGYEFAETGNYTITAEATDSSGATDTETFQVTVEESSESGGAGGGSSMLIVAVVAGILLTLILLAGGSETDTQRRFDN